MGFSNILVFLDKYDDAAPGLDAVDFTSEHIKTFIHGLVTASTTGFDPKVINGALK